MKRRLFMRWPNFRYKAVTLSYDDGCTYDRTVIEIMQKYGLKGTFNINSCVFRENRPNKLTKEELVELYTSTGNEVAVHGYRHTSLPEMPEALATYDVLHDREEIEAAFGHIVSGMAYANGVFSDEVVDILKKCGITYARTTVSTHSLNVTEDFLRWHPTCHHDDSELMELAQKLIEPAEPAYKWARFPRLLYVWGHSYEFNNNNNWDVLDKFGEYVGNREDVWYATNREIYEYVKAYDGLQFSVSGKMIYNPSAMDVYIDYYGNKYLIPAGKTVQVECPEGYV